MEQEFTWAERARISPWPYLQIILYFISTAAFLYYFGVTFMYVLVTGLLGTLLTRNLHDHAGNMVALYYAQIFRYDTEGSASMHRSAMKVMYTTKKGNMLCYRWALYMAARDRGEGAIFRRNLRSINGQLWKIKPTLRKN